MTRRNRNGTAADEITLCDVFNALLKYLETIRGDLMVAFSDRSLSCWCLYASLILLEGQKNYIKKKKSELKDFLG